MDYMRTVKDGVECMFCDVKFTYSGSLAMHLNMKHLTVGIEKCEDCDKEVLGEIALREHKENQHSIQYKCRDCDYSTNNKLNLTNHKIIHSDGPNKYIVECPICKAVLKGGKKYLKKHIRLRHEKKRLCKKCDLSIDKEEFQTHLCTLRCRKSV